MNHKHNENEVWNNPVIIHWLINQSGQSCQNRQRIKHLNISLKDVPSPEIGEADIIKKASASLCDSLLKKFWGVLSIVDLAYVCIVCSHEGRSWYSAHRGILWIASTAKPPQPSEIAAVEDFYRKYYSGVFAENCLCFIDWCRFIWQVHLSVTA